MSDQSTQSSHPVLSCTDGIAARLSDSLMLVARVLVVVVFIVTAWSGSPNAGYLGSLGVPNAPLVSTVAIAVEFIVAFSLILGVATRYGALLGLLYVLVATLLAHRYWQYPEAQQLAQKTNFLKNIAIFGGLLLVFVNGAGRFSIDRVLSGKR